MAKRFFYVSAGLLCLALAYHFGATSATAQAPGNPVVAMTTGYNAVITSNGDVYRLVGGPTIGPWVRDGNVFTGASTPVQQSTFGAVKARYR
jgi:hypothetical protein